MFVEFLRAQQGLRGDPEATFSGCSCEHHPVFIPRARQMPTGMLASAFRKYSQQDNINWQRQRGEFSENPHQLHHDPFWVIQLEGSFLMRFNSTHDLKMRTHAVTNGGHTLSSM